MTQTTSAASKCHSEGYSIESTNDPYDGHIRQFLISNFPNVTGASTGDILDLLTEAIVATGQIRYGPRPSPESLVSIREVISYWINRQHPIPFLVPWGSEKPDGSGVDIAELMALKTLKCLQDRVHRHYVPGVRFVIRLEDVSAPHLFFDRPDQARKDAALYTDGFDNLVTILGLRSFITPFKESSKVSESAFNEMADSIVPIMEQHIMFPTDMGVTERVVRTGWSPSSEETISHYLKLYTSLYPDAPASMRVHRLARYFAGALARIKLGITGKDAAWEGMNLELSFSGPVPGIPADRAKRRLLYRTMPSSITANHIPAWRAKGYLCCNEESTSAKLSSFRDPPSALNTHDVVLHGNGISQMVQADYRVV
jgi:hypothetical protein